MEKVLGGTTVQVNEEGYLTDFSQWNKEVGTELAKEADLILTPRHWEVLDYLQTQFKEEIPLSIRKIGKSEKGNGAHRHAGCARIPGHPQRFGCETLGLQTGHGYVSLQKRRHVR